MNQAFKGILGLQGGNEVFFVVVASQETKGQGLGEDRELVWEGESGRDVGQHFNEAGQRRKGEVRDQDNNVSGRPGHGEGHSGDVIDEWEGVTVQCIIHVSE